MSISTPRKRISHGLWRKRRTVPHCNCPGGTATCQSNCRRCDLCGATEAGIYGRRDHRTGRTRYDGRGGDRAYVWRRYMTLLLDTRLLLCGAANADRLPATARALMNDPENELLFSAASLWEIAIKNNLGREDFRADSRLLRRRSSETWVRRVADCKRACCDSGRFTRRA